MVTNVDQQFRDLESKIIQKACLFDNKTIFYILVAPPQPTNFIVEIRDTATITTLMYRWTIKTSFPLDYLVINLCKSSNVCEDDVRLKFSDFDNPFDLSEQTQEYQQKRLSQLKAGHYFALFYSTFNFINSSKSYYYFTVGKYCM